MSQKYKIDNFTSSAYEFYVLICFFFLARSLYFVLIRCWFITDALIFFVKWFVNNIGGVFQEESCFLFQTSKKKGILFYYIFWDVLVYYLGRINFYTKFSPVCFFFDYYKNKMYQTPIEKNILTISSSRSTKCCPIQNSS